MDTNRNRIIGERIRSSRERHHLTLEETAARSGEQFSAARLANYEQGIRRPGIEEVEAIAAVFEDVSAAWLLKLDETGTADTAEKREPVMSRARSD